MIPIEHPGIVIVVEEASICRLVIKVLSREAWDVIETGAQRANELLEGNAPPVKLLITNRPQDFERFAGSIPILYVTSAPDWEFVARTRRLRVLQKPFHATELARAVKELTAQAAGCS